MKVSVYQVNQSTKKAYVRVGDKTVETRIVLPNNKGAENDLWVDLRPIKALLGEGEHKNWLTIPRTIKEEDRVEVETLKKPNLPFYVSIKNLMNYVSPSEYEIARQIFAKAELKLAEEKAKLSKDYEEKTK